MGWSIPSIVSNWCWCGGSQNFVLKFTFLMTNDSESFCVLIPFEFVLLWSIFQYFTSLIFFFLLLNCRSSDILSQISFVGYCLCLFIFLWCVLMNKNFRNLKVQCIVLFLVNAYFAFSHNLSKIPRNICVCFFLEMLLDLD